MQLTHNCSHYIAPQKVLAGFNIKFKTLFYTVSSFPKPPTLKAKSQWPSLNFLMTPPVFSKEGIFLLVSACLSSPRHPAILSKPLFFNRTVSVSMNSVCMLRCLSEGSFIHKGSGNQPLNTFRDTYESRLLPCKTKAQPVERRWPAPLGVQERLILRGVGKAFPSLWLPDAVTCKALPKGGKRCQSLWHSVPTECWVGIRHSLDLAIKSDKVMRLQ